MICFMWGDVVVVSALIYHGTSFEQEGSIFIAWVVVFSHVLYHRYLGFASPEPAAGGEPFRAFLLWECACLS